MESSIYINEHMDNVVAQSCTHDNGILTCLANNLNKSFVKTSDVQTKDEILLCLTNIEQSQVPKDFSLTGVPNGLTPIEVSIGSAATEVSNGSPSSRFPNDCHLTGVPNGCCPTGVPDSFTSDSCFQLVLQAVDYPDLLISYCASRTFSKLLLHSVALAKVKKIISDLIEQLISYKKHCFGQLHLVDLLKNLFTKHLLDEHCKTQASYTELQSAVADGLCIQFMNITHSIFTRCEDRANDRIRTCSIFSLISLACKLCKYFQRCLGVKNQCDTTISTHRSWSDIESKIIEYLLTKLSVEDIPQLCIPKLLNFLLQSLYHPQDLAVRSSYPENMSRLAKVLVTHIFVMKDGTSSTEGDCVCPRNAVTQSRTKRFRDCIVSCIFPLGTCEGFGGYSSRRIAANILTKDDSRAQQSVVDVDRRMLRRILLLVLKSLAVITREEMHKRPPTVDVTDITKYLCCVHELICWTLSGSCFAEIFLEQDDMLIEALLCVFDIYAHLKENSGATNEFLHTAQLLFSPHYNFIMMLDNTGWDPSLFLDLLMSPETPFLLYLSRQLMCMIDDWTEWLHACSKYSSNKNVQILGVDAINNYDSEPVETSGGELINAQPHEQSVMILDKLNETNDKYAIQRGLRLTEYSISDTDSVQGDDAAEWINNVEVELQNNSRLKSNGGEDIDEESDDCQSYDNVLIDENQMDEGRTVLNQRNVHQRNVDRSNIECSNVEPSNVNRSKIDRSSIERSNTDRNDLMEYDDSEEEHDQIILRMLKFEENDVVFRNSNYNRLVTGSVEYNINSVPDCVKPSLMDVMPQFNDVLDKTMTVLIQLRLAVEKLKTKELFPYYVTPLLQSIERCEMLYESDDCNI